MSENELCVHKECALTSVCCCSATKDDVSALLDASLETGSLDGFIFDPEVARRAFDHFDKARI